MNKMLAIIKREYLTNVRSKFFIIMTVLGPVLMLGMTLLPAMMMRTRTGDAVRLAVVGQNPEIVARVRESILRRENRRNDNRAQRGAVSEGEMANVSAQYRVEEIALGDRSPDDVRNELNARVLRNDLDGYIVIPPDALAAGTVAYYSRNTSDVFTIEQIRNSINRAVADQRMIEARFDPAQVRELQRPVEMRTERVTASGSESETSGAMFFLAYAVGIMIYVTVLVYGQFVLSSVVEEKTTRIVEVLFSSVRAFPLMLGKLIGISLVALTQYVVWTLFFAAVTLYGVGAMAGSGFSLPRVSPLVGVYLILFFLVGYFVYSAIYALIGAMVTTPQEGGPLATPFTFLLIIGFFLSFMVIRNPNSTVSFWVSMIPFFSPITMLVRIVTETPPFWQILLSLVIGFGTAIGLVWLAARVYRTGMLMYGKRATIPEVWRWVRQA